MVGSAVGMDVGVAVGMDVGVAVGVTVCAKLFVGPILEGKIHQTTTMLLSHQLMDCANKKANSQTIPRSRVDKIKRSAAFIMEGFLLEDCMGFE